MEDVKQENVSEAPQEPAEQTAEQVSQPEQQTPVVEQSTPEVPVKTVPYERFAETNKKFREVQRQLAELKGSQQLNQYDPNDLESIMAHPFVQELAIKQAKQELTDYARTRLETLETIPASVKKAILTNVRGFVKETTSDIESAKLDIDEYIESIAEEEAQQAPTPKQFQVASTNVAKTDAQGTRPAEIARILAKPIDDWTAEDEAAVEQFSQSKK